MSGAKMRNEKQEPVTNLSSARHSSIPRKKNAARSTARKQPSLAAKADGPLGRLKEPKVTVHAHARARSKRWHTPILASHTHSPLENALWEDSKWVICGSVFAVKRREGPRERRQAARRQKNWQRSRWFSASSALPSTPNVEDKRSNTKPEIKMKRKQNEACANTTQEKERRRQRKRTPVRETAVAVAVDSKLCAAVSSWVASPVVRRTGAGADKGSKRNLEARRRRGED
ncbi:hypothetical protein C8R45DRAFT_1171277 [Mycena sanguinolenta]|nr:hypothetical protein C8R45DRAFT_1171277 [Mycena sanguinolenta]